jgi:non-ribosomal peptide synthetase component F
MHQQSNMQHESCYLEKLTLADRLLFDQFGKGPKEHVPFTLIHQAFEQITDLHPEAVAVRHHDGTSITYGELERRSNILSNKLAALGLLPRQRVCLVLQRSIHMVVAILAVLKANCQYVPLDGGVVPEETLSHILSDTGAPMVICLKKFESKVRACASDSTSILAIDADNHSVHGTSLRPESRITSSDGAYIIYTSGSYS